MNKRKSRFSPHFSTFSRSTFPRFAGKNAQTKTPQKNSVFRAEYLRRDFRANEVPVCGRDGLFRSGSDYGTAFLIACKTLIEIFFTRFATAFQTLLLRLLYVCFLSAGSSEYPHILRETSPHRKVATYKKIKERAVTPQRYSPSL